MNSLLYDIGLCHQGRTESYKTVTVKADSRQKAIDDGRKLLSPSTWESVRYVATRSNPDYVATMGLPPYSAAVSRLRPRG